MTTVIEMNNGQGKFEVTTIKEVVWLTPKVKKVITRYEYHQIDEK